LKKRILSLLLFLTLLLTTPALAAENSTGNFVRAADKTYSSQFSDVSAASAFYNNVAALYEYGLTVGKTDGTFGLNDSVTVSQVVIFAARIRSLYASGDAESGAAAYRTEGMATYEPYLLYLQAQGVLSGELDGTYYQSATRSAVAHVLANTLPSSALPAANDSLVTQAYATGKFISDVTEYTPYYSDILTLYKCGVCVGSDATGTYYPARSITRGALAAMLTRIVDASLRMTPAWNLADAYSAQGTSWGDLIFDSPAYIAAPSTAAEMDQDVAYMLANGSHTLSLTFKGGISEGLITQLMDETLSAAKSYCEQCYNSVSVSYSYSSGSVTLSFGAADCQDSELSTYREYTLSSAIAVHDALWESGRITPSMTEQEKAKVYYDWICQNCSYDYSAGDYSLSHIAYSLFKNKTAVCDGYTGAYNLLLKLEGISCYAQSNDDHIWTVATLDGTDYHIDTTWGDGSGAYTDYTYFAMTAAQSWSYHHW